MPPHHYDDDDGGDDDDDDNKDNASTLELNLINPILVINED